MRRAALILCLVPLPALAQGEDDKGYLTRLIEDNLSGDGVQVSLDGFAGAFSSEATFTEMRISDAEGVWLTIRDGAIAWNRSALLSGRVEVQTLRAAEIDIPRLPAGDGGTPSPEARGFSLPELPVSVTIGQIAAPDVRLGAPVLGEPVSMRIDGALRLADGEGEARLTVDRTDRPGDHISLQASYANASRLALVDLSFVEEAGGLAGRLLGLPDAPAIQLGVNGNGPIDDFTADLTLSTEGRQRLSGQIGVQTLADAAGRAETGFRADLGGDIAALFAPEYRPFFGSDLTVRAEGKREASGRLRVAQMDLRAREITLDGAVTLAPGGRPEMADVTLRIGQSGGPAVLLPVSGARTTVRSATADISFDAAKGEGWKAEAEVEGLARPDISIGRMRLGGSGRIAQTGDAAFGATIDFDATGLSASDPALAEAIGPSARGRAILHWAKGGDLVVPVLDLIGEDYGIDGRVTVSDLESGFRLRGAAEASLADLSRFSGLAGRPLSGRAEGRISGEGSPLAGDFDIETAFAGNGLAIGQSEIDRLLSGASTIALKARRDEAGTVIERLTAETSALRAEASGTLATDNVDLAADLNFSDLSVLGGGYRGRLAGKAALTGSMDRPELRAEATGSGLAIGVTEADRILAGESQLSLRAKGEDGHWRIEAFDLANPQLTAKASGTAGTTGASLDLSARLANLGLILPEFPGAVTAAGTLVQDGDSYSIDLGGEGPGGITTKVAGTADSTLSNLAVKVTGNAQAALANVFLTPRSIAGPIRFDLSVNGPPALSSLSGQVVLSEARIVDPEFGLALEGVGARADLGGGRAQLSAEGNVSGGGRLSISGPVALSPPFAGDLRLSLMRARLRDPELFDTRVSGELTISGPLAGGGAIGGALTLEDTEIRVPSASYGAGGTLVEMRHVNESAASRQTRARAGLIGSDGSTAAAGGAGGPSYAIDVSIAAPNRVFVRGRGLDAELGGGLRVTGRTDAMVPQGRLDLVRGRLDILGKRFVLDEGLIQLQGDFVPFIRFGASTENDGITSTVTVEGDARNPDIRFTSSPELPEEEVVAQLLFGRGLGSLSAFQAAQLASAVATLAGKGGEGIIGKLRKGTGLDDLDLTTDTEGNATLKAGKYLSDNLYTDVTVGAGGTTEIQLNLDVTKHITARGRVNSDGESGIGVFIEKDY